MRGTNHLYKQYQRNALLISASLALSLFSSNGHTQDGAIGGKAWHDDGDGTYQIADLPNSGVTVELAQWVNGSYQSYSTTTDDMGEYTFDNLPAGWYRVNFESQQDCILAPPNQGYDDTIDSDPWPDTGRTGWFKLTTNRPTNFKNDAGYVGCVLPPPAKAMCEVVGSSGTTFDFTFESVALGSTVVRNGQPIQEISGDGTFSDSPGGPDGTVYEYAIESNGNIVAVCGEVSVLNPPEPPEACIAYETYVNGSGGSQRGRSSFLLAIPRTAVPNGSTILSFEFQGGYSILSPNFYLPTPYPSWGPERNSFAIAGGLLGSSSYELENAEIVATFRVGYDGPQKEFRLCGNGKFTYTPPPMSPIALDIDGSGIVERINGEFAFDFTGNGGLVMATEWFAPTEGILVDTRIPGPMTGAHVFGDMGGQYTDGYAKLATLDANGNGQIAGEELEGLALWTDANSNAMADAGEITSLAEHQVVSLSTSHTAFVSMATLANGTTLVTEDLWFQGTAVHQ